MGMDHRFTTEVCFDEEERDGYMKHYVPVPDAIAEALMPTKGQPRLVGTLDGVAFTRVLTPHRDGGYCLKFGAGWLRDAGFEVGMSVEVAVGPDPNPDHVEIAAELEEALRGEPAIAAFWQTVTSGKGRTLAYPVDRAKRPETRHRKATWVIAEVEKLMDAKSK